MAKTPIVGVAYRSRSRSLADQRAINLYVEVVETKTGKEPAALYDCPGLRLLKAKGTGPIRGVHAVAQTLYFVSGSELFAATTAFTATKLGNLQTTSGPVSIIDNGSQVAVSDGQAIYVWSMGAFIIPVLASIGPPGTLVYQDTVGVYNELGSKNLWQSQINDLTDWPALFNTVEDGSPDNIVGLTDTHRQIVAVKENHTAYYINAGISGFVFQRLEGVYPDIGCVAPASITRVGEAVLWLGRDDIGQGVVFMVTSYEPQRTSTYAIDNTIQGYNTITDAVGFGYQQGGHVFYCLNFPSGGQTWVLDLTVSGQLGYPAWHQRAAFANGNLTNWEPVCACEFAGQVVVGSGTGPNLYALDLNVFTDNGEPRKRLRSWRGMATPDQRRSQRYSFLELDYEAGATVPPGANPQWVLRYSDDNQTWSSEIFASAGRTGQLQNQARFNRLGTCRRGSDSDRTFELSTTDNFRVALFGGDLG